MQTPDGSSALLFSESSCGVDFEFEYRVQWRVFHLHLEFENEKIMTCRLRKEGKQPARPWLTPTTHHPMVVIPSSLCRVSIRTRKQEKLGQREALWQEASFNLLRYRRMLLSRLPSTSHRFSLVPFPLRVPSSTSEQILVCICLH